MWDRTRAFCKLRGQMGGGMGDQEEAGESHLVCHARQRCRIHLEPVAEDVQHEEQLEHKDGTGVDHAEEAQEARRRHPERGR